MATGAIFGPGKKKDSKDPTLPGASVSRDPMGEEDEEEWQV